MKYEQVCRSWRDLLAKSPSPGVWGHLWTLVGSPAPERYGEDQEPIIFVPDTPKQGNRRATWLAQRASGVRRIGFGNPEHYLVLPNLSLSSPLCRLLGRLEVLNIPTLDAYLPGATPTLRSPRTNVLFSSDVHDMHQFFSQRGRVALLKLHLGCPCFACILATFAFADI